MESTAALDVAEPPSATSRETSERSPGYERAGPGDEQPRTRFGAQTDRTGTAYRRVTSVGGRDGGRIVLLRHGNRDVANRGRVISDRTSVLPTYPSYN